MYLLARRSTHRPSWSSTFLPTRPLTNLPTHTPTDPTDRHGDTSPLQQLVGIWRVPEWYLRWMNVPAGCLWRLTKLSTAHVNRRGCQVRRRGSFSNAFEEIVNMLYINDSIIIIMNNINTNNSMVVVVQMEENLPGTSAVLAPFDRKFLTTQIEMRSTVNVCK